MNIEEFNREVQKQKSLFNIKECFHHDKDECKGKIKQAHSIQNNGRISIIASEVNKNISLYTLTNFIYGEQNMLKDLKPIGRKEASTFFGFCDFHDSKLFSPIENFEFDHDSEKHLFLHSYRSFAHSYHRKKEELNYWSNFEKNKMNNGSLFSQHMQSRMIGGNEIALAELEKGKHYLDNAIANKNYDSLEYIVYQKEGLYPFAVSSQMSPKITYSGKSMNNHHDPNIPYENPIITFLPDKNSTIVIIAAFPFENKSITLLDELDSLNDLKLEKAITSLIIANCENTIISPLFWQNLSKKSQRKLLDEFTENTINSTYSKKWFNSSFNFFDENYEIEKLKKKTAANNV
ncbi:hypothetical protein [Tenacibaculum sp.]|uniref:hypothetical protein n=1 Tax=Tenacibaculum sp. TaxID=1906242 RepID=UPI003D0EA31F